MPVYTSCSYGTYKNKTPIRVKRSGHYVENVDEYGNVVRGFGLYVDKNVQVERLNKKGKFVRDDDLRDKLCDECNRRYYNQQDFEYDFYRYGYENDKLWEKYDRLIRRDDDGNLNPLYGLELAVYYKDDRSETHAIFSGKFERSDGHCYLKELEQRPHNGIDRGFGYFKVAYLSKPDAKKKVSLKLNSVGKDKDKGKGKKGKKNNKENEYDFSL